jgi:serine/threonine-protein kinase
VNPDEVRECLDKVLASPSFAGAVRLQQFLRFVVEETLEGRADEIKESVVALRVFGRRGDFDSRSDSVVRVQATYLRKRLREYYRAEGADDRIAIELPPGSYAPVFRPVASLPAPAVERKRRKWLLPAAGLAILAAALGMAAYVWLAGHSPTSIAVLPFATLNAAPDSDYLAEGIAEDLMTALARAPGLRVAARTSAFQFGGRNANARSIGRELGVRFLLEGSVRGGPDHLKIAAQLVNAWTGFDLWSADWEGPAADAPVFEEQIVREVRRVLGKPPGKREGANAAAARPPVAAAQEAYWRGRILLSKSPEIAAGSIPFLEQAVAADPQCAAVHAALTTACVMALYHGTIGQRDEALRKARREGARALALDPGSSEAYASLAMIAFAFDHDWAAAQRGFEQALELNPSDARAHLQYAMGLVTRGRFSKAIAHADRARTLDPLSFAASNYVAIALYCAGRYDESIAAARHTLAADPGYASAHVAIGRGLAAKGDSAQAVAEFDLALRKYGREPWILGRLGYALARGGQRAQALDVASEIDRQHGPAVQTAFVYAGLGDRQRALDALDRAFAEANIDLNFMAVDPMLASLRAEPRFLALKRRMGL